VLVTATDYQGHVYTSTEAFRKLGPSPDGVEVVRGVDNVVRVDGSPFFPRGLYDANDLASLQENSSNLAVSVTVPAVGSQEYKKEMQLGVRRILSLVPMGGSCKGNDTEPVTCMDGYLQQQLDMVRSDPQVIGFAFEDEWIYDRYAQHAYDYILTHDPYRLMYETVYDPYNLDNAWRAADVVAVDPYPITPTVSRSVLEVGLRLDEARQAVGERATIWDVPQVFGALPFFTAPSSGQLRAMVYLALIHGAAGTFGYSADPGGIYPMPTSCLPLTPAHQMGDPDWGLHWYLWCTQLASEFESLQTEANALLPILTSGTDVTGEWSMQPRYPTTLDWTARSYGGAVYLIVQNTSGTAASATFSPITSAAGKVLRSGRFGELFNRVRVRVYSGNIATTFAPYESRVFVLRSVARESLNLRVSMRPQ
jgi:hypothetical protein